MSYVVEDIDEAKEVSLYDPNSSFDMTPKELADSKLFPRGGTLEEPPDRMMQGFDLSVDDYGAGKF